MYKVILCDMPVAIRSFVKSDGEWHTIVINARLSRERQRECFLHELKHIRNGDFEKADADAIERAAHI